MVVAWKGMDFEGSVCGVDEAGRGPVLGPLVVCAVYVSDESVLTDLGVKDSKKLTPKKREALAPKIMDVAEAVEVIVLEAEGIDARRKCQSLNDVELDLFAEATSRHKCQIIYADCPDVNETSFGRRLADKVPGPQIVARHKADDTYPVVSAASIVAKVTRDRLVREIEEEFGCPIGSGYPSDPVTIAFIENWIKENGRPPKHTRTSWETVRRMMSVASVRRITDW